MNNEQLTVLKSELLNNKMEEFIQLYKQGVAAWIRAGEVLLDMLKEEPHIFDLIIERFPNINAGILGSFERMGRHELHPQLLISNSPGHGRLAKMPFSVQERYLEEPVPLLVETESGPDTLLVMTRDLTSNQARQVFAKGRIRTPGEQRAFMMEQRSLAAKPAGGTMMPWSIKHGKVEFRDGVVLSRTELMSILVQLG